MSAAALAINLRSSDLPSYQATPVTASEADFEAEADELRRCLGMPSIDGAGFESPDFTRGAVPRFVHVGSAVGIAESPSDVRRELAAYQRPSAEACMQQYALSTITQILEDKGVSTTTPEVARLATSAPGTFGFRVMLSAYGNGRRLPVTVDLLGVGKGRTEATLVTTSIGPVLPDQQRDALFGKVLARVKTHAV